ncbi:hypothetical protein M9458_013426, partial [Cirrhinus mrigala]
METPSPDGPAQLGPVQPSCTDEVLLVVPYWLTQTSFLELMLLDLLTQRGGTLWHPHPELWKLHV